MQLANNQKAAQAQEQGAIEKQEILEQIEGFVINKGRLPCPAVNTNSPEAFIPTQGCEFASGWLPKSSLGLPPRGKTWWMAVATLGTAGPPASQALTKGEPFAVLNPQQLAEIVYAPPTGSQGLSGSALPAIHVCLQTPGAYTPAASERGCGGHTLHTASAVLVISEKQAANQAPCTSTLNSNRSHQFFTQPNDPACNPAWLSYERLAWLWMRSGVYNNIP